MSSFIAELIGTALLIILGGGVVANVLLNKSKGQNGGWIVITLGWAMAVFVGVYASTHIGSGGHINPAVTLALASIGSFDASLILPYIAGQLLGAFIGAVLVWISYYKHFEETDDAGLKLAIFSTSPAIRSVPHNLATEIIGTFVLVFGALTITPSAVELGTLSALPVALLVLGIGLSLGGPTGYAINPARDLAPRIAHAILPIYKKGTSDWSYSWIPIIGPITGGILAALLYKQIM